MIDRSDRDHERRNPRLPELDILPFMNLMTLLIPFLLVSATFVSLATVGVAAPAIGDEPTPRTGEELGLVVGVTSEGFVVRADQPLTDGEEQATVPLLHDPVACRLLLCGASSPDCFAPPSCHDHDGLNGLLREVKAAYPHEREVIIAPDGDVPYQALITAMDASREAIDDDGSRIALFPDVGMSGGVK